MTKIPIKGVVSSNDDAVIYDWLGMDCASPKQVEDALATNDGNVEVNIASGGGECRGCFRNLYDAKGLFREGNC